MTTPGNTREDRWLQMADQEVDALWNGLPEDLQAACQPVAVLLERVPDPALVGQGFTSDLLGLFSGPTLAERDAWPEPTEIRLYLDNLAWEVEGDPDRFREEVRITLLHELGHFLGLDEDEVARRGLG